MDQRLSGETDALRPPVARPVPHEIELHGDRRSDPWHWLRERSNPLVREYLDAENAYCAAVLGHTLPLQKRLYDEFVERMQETDSTVPDRVDDYFYYTRAEQGKQYPIHCRRRGSVHAPEEIVLDENELSTDPRYLNVGSVVPSSDHALLAYTVDRTGSEAYEVHVRRIDNGEEVEAPIPNAHRSLAWSNDDRILFYATLDEKIRPCRLFRHRIGQPSATDVLLHEEKDEAFFLSVSKTRTRKFIAMSLDSRTTTEIHVIDADAPESAPRLICPRRPEIECTLAHHGDSFYVLTNEEARNFRLMQVPVSDPARDHWREIIPHRKAVRLEDLDAFAGHLVVYERENGLQQIRIMEMSSGQWHSVRPNEPVYTIWASENPMFDSRTLRFNYSSLLTPRRVVDYDMSTREQTVRKQYYAGAHFDPEMYVSERVFASAADGTKVPISLVCRRDVARDGSAPLVLFGYGAYGATMDAHFSANRVSLLDRGVVFAIAHVRGGGEMGREWYERGKLLNKRNTFTDYIACAEHLIDKKYTSRGNISGYGGSAGGMLIGAVANMKPELFASIVAHVPFVDVLTTMLDASIPLTVIEYEEWGDPAERKFYEYIRSYSPYDNVQPQKYPHMLVTAGMNDPRVQYWEPAKWVARLRSLGVGADRRLVLKTRMGEGHSGASGRYDYLRDVAFEYAFILDTLTIKA